MAPPGAPREQKRKAGFGTKREALAAMNELQAAVGKGAYVSPSRLTVQTFLEGWLPSAKARLRPGAYDACEMHVRRYIVPCIGDVPLQALTRERVRRLYGQLADSGRVRGDARLSTKTVHNIHSTLCRALADAVRDRLITHNPAEAAHRQPDSPEQLTWTGSQVRVFLDAVATDRLYALWRLAVTTGLRRGELVGLRWRDVDFATGRITVVQQRAKGGGAVSTGPTKNKRGRRLLSIDDTTLSALRLHRETQEKDKELLGAGYRDEDFVFCRVDGKALHPDRVTKLLRQHVRAAGLPWIKVHGLRHTHATILLQAGVHPKVVQERLGHSSIAMTLDTYSHAIPAMQEDAATRGADIIDKEAADDEQHATDDTAGEPSGG
jgi:integrase